jgi:hypothetical protein
LGVGTEDQHLNTQYLNTLLVPEPLWREAVPGLGRVRVGREAQLFEAGANGMKFSSVETGEVGGAAAIGETGA